ncbi:MAG: penicillin-binding protein activator [Holosporaceae bacterium]|jgi:hypothetical protein|nr:penicillin-binding protein activator [Holosporaceae bacterium]
MFRPIKQFLLLLIFALAACSPVYRSTVQKKTEEMAQKARRPAIDPLLDPNLERMIGEKAENSILLALPLSGKNASVGRSILAACFISLKESDYRNIDVYVIDSSDKNLDMHQIHSQLKYRNLRAIIGPVFYGEIKKFSALFPTVPLFSLSNNEKAKGNHVFICGLAPKDEIRQLFSTVKFMGIDSIFVALPEGEFGDTLLRCIEKELDEDCDMEVMRYVHISAENARKCVKNSNKKAVFALNPAFNVPEKMQRFFREVSAGNDDDVADRYRSRKIFTLSSCVLADEAAWNGALFAFAKNEDLENFSAKYKIIFEQNPSILDIVAYDISKIIFQKIAENEAELLHSNSAYKNFIFSGSFSGCLGEFALHKKYGLSRRLSTLRHVNGRNIVVNQLKDHDIAKINR